MRRMARIAALCTIVVLMAGACSDRIGCSAEVSASSPAPAADTVALHESHHKHARIKHSRSERSRSSGDDADDDRDDDAFNPRPSTPGHTRGGAGSGGDGGFDYSQYIPSAAGGGGQQQGGAGAGAGAGGFDYSKYIPHSAAPADERRSASPSSHVHSSHASRESSSPITAGAEGSSSNIRASGEMARGFMPGGNNNRAAETEVLVAGVPRSTLHLANVPSAALQRELSERSSHHASKTEDHKRRKEKDRAEADAPVEEDDRDATPQTKEQDRQAAKWQEIGREYARAYARNPPPPQSDERPRTASDAQPSSDSKDDDRPRDPRAARVSLAMERDVGSAADNTTSSESSEHQSQDEPDLPAQEEDPQRAELGAGANATQPFPVPKPLQKDDTDESVDPSVESSRERRHRRASARAAERNERMARDIREQHEQQKKEERDASSRHHKSSRSRTEEEDSPVEDSYLIAASMAPPGAFVDEVAAADPASASGGLTFGKFMLLVFVALVVAASIVVVYRRAQNKQEYQLIETAGIPSGP